MSIKRGVDKEDVVRICSGILATKMNKVIPFAGTWMDPENIILSEVRQRKTDHLCVESKN